METLLLTLQKYNRSLNIITVNLMLLNVIIQTTWTHTLPRLNHEKIKNPNTVVTTKLNPYFKIFSSKKMSEPEVFSGQLY